MTTPTDPDRRCAGEPLLCRRCEVPLVLDPTGPWCRTCRRAWPGAPQKPRCPYPAVATGRTPRTRGLRLCRIHARLLVDAAGPDAVILDQPPR